MADPTDKNPKQDRPAPKGVGMYWSGRADISESAEELLFQITSGHPPGRKRPGYAKSAP
jgi:hypothetical protein